MIFYRTKDSPHPAILFNPKTETPIYEFTKGQYETNDPETIGLLMAMGFPTEEPAGPNIQQVMETPVAMEMLSRGSK